MRAILLIVILTRPWIAWAQSGPMDSVIYVLLDTSLVKWDRPSQVCRSGRVELKYAYVLPDSNDHHELTRHLRRHLKSERRYDRIPCRFFSVQARRRWSRVEQFISDHHISTLHLTDEGVRFLRQIQKPAEVYSYRILEPV